MNITSSYLTDAAAILRAKRLTALLDCIHFWGGTTGERRAIWRQTGLYLLAEWKRLYTVPERAAFERAVAQGKTRSKRENPDV